MSHYGRFQHHDCYRAMRGDACMVTLPDPTPASAIALREEIFDMEYT
jgi:hypothetical protein